MTAPSSAEAQRRLSSSSQPTSTSGLPASLPLASPGSEHEDGQGGYLSGHSGLETPDEDAEYDHDSDYEREDRMDDLYTATSIKSGYLHKKGERRRAWQKRFFVLRPRSLGYYKDSKEYKLLRQIPLQDMKTCAQVQVQKHDYVFGIVTAERNFYIQASSNHERDEWVQAINEAIRRANAMDTGLASDVLHEDDLNTPQGYDSPGLRTSANTQQQQQTTRPIAITGGRQSRGAYEQTQSHSLVSTTGSSSVSAFSPTGHPEPPSSYTSQPSSTQASYTGNGLSSVSPIPYAVSPPRSVPLHESSGGDVTLERLADTPSMSKHRQYSNSTTDSYIGQPGNFDTIRRSSGGVPQSPRPPTISSSEDDEDDAEMPTTPLSASGQELEIVQSPVLSPTQPPPAHSPAPIAKPNAQSKLKEQPGPAESHHPDPAKVVLAGYLTKQGKRRNWRKRWFSLSSTALSYSRSHMDTKVHHQIPLGRVLDVMEYAPTSSAGRRHSRSSDTRSMSGMTDFSAPDTSSKKYEHCFQIITPKRTLKLCATDSQQETQWITAIRTLLAQTRQTHTLPIAGGNTQNASSTSYSTRPSSPQSPMARSSSQQRPLSTTHSTGPQAPDTARHSSMPTVQAAASTSSSSGSSNPSKTPLPSIQTRLLHHDSGVLQGSEAQFFTSPASQTAPESFKSPTHQQTALSPRVSFQDQSH